MSACSPRAAASSSPRRLAHALARSPTPGAGHAVAQAEPGVIAQLLECKGSWCRLETQGIKGWLPRADLWGVYPDEAVAE